MPPPPARTHLNRPLLLLASLRTPQPLQPARDDRPARKRPRGLSSTAPRAAASAEATYSDRSAALRALCNHGQLAQALWLLESSPEPPDEDAYVALFRLCEWRRAVEAGMRACAHADAEHPSFGLRLGNAMLSMLVRFGETWHAWRVFAKMPERDVFSWNVMVGGYGKVGFLEEALDLYYRMLWAGVRPDVYTFPCVLRTCGGIPDWRMGREVHAHVLRFGFGDEVDVLNALITMYAKCGDVVAARKMYMSLGRMGDAGKIFSRMETKDAMSWTAMISGYEKNGFPDKALEVYALMELHNVSPDDVTIASALAACACLERLDVGIKLHELAQNKGFIRHMLAHVKPNSVTFIAALSACAAIGTLRSGWRAGCEESGRPIWKNRVESWKEKKEKKTSAKKAAVKAQAPPVEEQIMDEKEYGDGEDSGLAPVDFFVSTVDPLKEPPLITANTRNLLRKWVPFCKKYSIEPRAPEFYFSQKIDYLKDKIQPSFVKERRAMKRDYEEYKVRINALVAKAQKTPEEVWIMQDGTPWPWNNPHDHLGMMQVFLGETGARDFDGNELPRLVYVSRQKRPGYQHHKKAGAMNALVNMKGLDGIQGPVYVGTGGCFYRQALYGYGPPSLPALPKSSVYSWCCC
ncbi:hypothetical protein E2562_029220 [Oryza meyeriana var. granulata]|uniref:Pentatricopeptide repeat-containing protein n=1 Tax=Oryza meyeriana var. granulata TaxID=110450 RepID=A0A6G1EQR6_9ORYZ|nr:hypothetical protein E2562_029220 [Oryza meyeriana var. granulata]